MNLQIALIALGVLVIAAIYFFSRWQQARTTSKKSRGGSNSIKQPSLRRDGPSFGQQDSLQQPIEEIESDRKAAQTDLDRLSQEPGDIPVLESRVDSVDSVDSNDDFTPSAPEGEQSEHTHFEQGDTASSYVDDDQYVPQPEDPVRDSRDQLEDIEEGIVENYHNQEVKLKLNATGDASVEDRDAGEVTEHQDDEMDQSRRLEQANAESQFDQGLNLTEPRQDRKITQKKSFLGSINPFSRIKGNIQSKLDSVKSEREKSHRNDGKPAQGANSYSEGDSLALESADIPTPKISTDPSLDILLSTPGSGQTAAITDHGEGQNQPAQSVADNNLNPVPLQPAEGFEKLSQIDYYVKLSGDRDVSRESVLAIYRDGASGISRTHSIYGLLLPEKVWRDLENEPEESRFGDLVITMQLVDQLGPVSDEEMTRFSSLVMKLSESTGRGFAFMAPIEDAQKQAQAIDQFRNQFDSIFVVNIRPSEDEMFEGAAIERCATQIGLIADQNNFYARHKPVGKQKVCLYSLANMSDSGEFDIDNMRAVRTRGVTFFTRPAVNRSPGAVFAEMVDAAKAFASRIKGEVVAPGYESLSMDDVEVIRRSIEKVAGEMESYGISPGSEEANRLF